MVAWSLIGVGYSVLQLLDFTGERGNKAVVHTLKLGSLYLDDKPVTLGAGYCLGQAISFGATTSNEAISWVPVNGLLIADRCLLTNISWDDLNVQNLAFGKEIKIQGFQFRSRLLKVGNTDRVPNEWDAALDIVGDNDDLWHWDEIFFWGQDAFNTHASYRVVRGYGSARRLEAVNKFVRHSSLGFRPVLDLLYMSASALRQGQKVLIIGPDGVVQGILCEQTDYDLIVRAKPNNLIGKVSFLSNISDNMVVIDLSRILGIVGS